MQTTIAFLRGVNVGGRARVPMAGLREIATALGLEGARTYLQSGNLLLATGGEPPATLARDLEQAIAEAFAVGTTVILRTGAELAAAAATNPFPDAERDPVTLHVAFLASRPTVERVEGLDPGRFLPDTFAVRGSEVYVHYPSGAGRSKLGLDYFERGLGVKATARNWNTVTKLLAIVGA